MTVVSARFDERLPQIPERTVLIQKAFRLEWLTLAWMAIEALVAIASGVVAGSLTLTSFGFDSVIELASAGVLIWRLTDELHGSEELSKRSERIASRSGGRYSSCLRPTSSSAPPGASGHITQESFPSPVSSSPQSQCRSCMCSHDESWT